MSDMQITKLKNGATLLYQHQNLNDTTQAVIGFKTGSRCDGEYIGLTHLIEHLWFAGNKKYSDEEMFRFTKMTNTNHGAATTYNYVYTTLDCVSENLDKVLEYNTEAMLNKDFTKERIDQEIEVISEEILLTHSNQTLLQQALAHMNNSYNVTNIVGTKELLLRITPEIIKEYATKYFVAENLIASVVSNLPMEEIVEKFNNTKIAQLPSSKENEVPFIIPQRYENNDSYFLAYAHGQENISLGILVPSQYTGELQYLQEIDYDILRQIEAVKFNDFSGKLYQKTRIDKQLAYSSYFSGTTSDDTLISIFSAETSPAKLNDCILAIADTIREARSEGVTEQDFADIIQLYKSQKSREYNEGIDCGDARFNAETVLNNEFVYPAQIVLNRIQDMGREYYDKLFKELYNQDRIVLTVTGDYNVPTLPSIEQIKKWAFTENPDRSLISYESITDNPETCETLKGIIDYYTNFQAYLQESEEEYLASLIPKPSIKERILNKFRRKETKHDTNLSVSQDDREQ